MSNVECGRVPARLDTSGMRARHEEMTQSQRVESEPDRHKAALPDQSGV